MSHSTVLLVLTIAITIAFGQLSFEGSERKRDTQAQKDGAQDPRLGLLASSLGVDPVPGASYPEKGNPSQYEHGEFINGGGGVGLIGQGGQGGNSYPVIGGGSGRCQCVLKHLCPGRPGNNGHGPGNGNGEYTGPGPVGPGLITGTGPGGVHNPDIDGTGNIDIRIVNRPPAGVVCQPGELYCCDDGNVAPLAGPQDPYHCGASKIIPVSGYTETYGQADFGEYPWLAVILSDSNNYIGAGVLIDNYHILTAAHKVQDYKPGFPMKVRFGEWNAQDDSEPYKNIEIGVARVEIHPAFNSQNLQNDVALVKLAQPIDISAYPHIKPACLPKLEATYAGQRCWVAGFGKDAFKVGKHSYILKEVDLPIVEGDECEARLRSTRLGNRFYLNRKSFLCAGGEDGKDACTGDGGAPLVCKDAYTGYFSVVGLVAWGIGCAEYGIPGVYVNVPNYVGWIQERIQYK